MTTNGVRLSLFTTIVALCVISGQSPATPWAISLRRAGPLEIGMTIGQVRRIIGDSTAFLVQALKQNSQLRRESDASPCAYLATREVPEQIGLMFQNGRLARVDVWKSGIRTMSGAQVGDAETRILELYGARITISQHHYRRSGRYLTFTPVGALDRGYLILFETDGQIVTAFRIGTRDAVAQVEGCA